MNGKTGWTDTLGAVSCGAFLVALLIYLGLASTKEYHPNWIWALFGAAVSGLVSGIAGLLSSRKRGRPHIASIIGCVLNLPAVVLVLLLLTVMLGHRS